MATIQTNDLSQGMCIMHNNEMFIVMEKEFTAMGKGASFTRTKLRNVKTGKVIPVTFKSGEKMEQVELEYHNVQYLYTDGSKAYFMDPTTFEQYEVVMGMIAHGTDFLHEEAKYVICMYQGEVVALNEPIKITLTVTESAPATKGNTATNAFKEVTLETGAKVQVPMFISQGEKILVNTELYEYVSKA
jgi:elongation factor P